MNCVLLRFSNFGVLLSRVLDVEKYSMFCLNYILLFFQQYSENVDEMCCTEIEFL